VPNCSKTDYLDPCVPGETGENPAELRPVLPAPPLGVEPAWVWHEKRIRALVEAVQRQLALDARLNMEKVSEWLSEAAELAERPHPSKPIETR
jgi:hypothetical protein